MVFVYVIVRYRSRIDYYVFFVYLFIWVWREVRFLVFVVGYVIVVVIKCVAFSIYGYIRWGVWFLVNSVNYIIIIRILKGSVLVFFDVIQFVYYVFYWVYLIQWRRGFGCIVNIEIKLDISVVEYVLGKGVVFIFLNGLIINIVVQGVYWEKDLMFQANIYLVIDMESYIGIGSYMRGNGKSRVCQVIIVLIYIYFGFEGSIIYVNQGVEIGFMGRLVLVKVIG